MGLDTKISDVDICQLLRSDGVKQPNLLAWDVSLSLRDTCFQFAQKECAGDRSSKNSSSDEEASVKYALKEYAANRDLTFESEYQLG